MKKPISSIGILFWACVLVFCLARLFHFSELSGLPRDLFIAAAVAIFTFAIGLIVLKRKTDRKRFLHQQFDSLDGHAFESWCADLLRANGFRNVTVTQGSNDQGVDILAERNGSRYAIQCKRYSSRLGNAPVQEVTAGRSVYGCSRAAVMTNSYFTPSARQAARANSVELWDRDDLLAMLSALDDS